MQIDFMDLSVNHSANVSKINCTTISLQLIMLVCRLIIVFILLITLQICYTRSYARTKQLKKYEPDKVHKLTAKSPNMITPNRPVIRAKKAKKRPVLRTKATTPHSEITLNYDKDMALRADDELLYELDGVDLVVDDW